MRILIFIAITIVMAHTATGAILKTLNNTQSYNKQTEQALSAVASN